MEFLRRGLSAVAETVAGVFGEEEAAGPRGGGRGGPRGGPWGGARGRKAARTDGTGPAGDPLVGGQAPRPEPVLRSPPGGGRSSGGVQGLRWYASGMREDGDGDVAEEFLGEPPPGPGCGQGSGSGPGPGPGLKKLESRGLRVPPRVVGLRQEGGVLLK